MTLQDLAVKSGHYLSKNSPTILMGLSLAGVLSTAYLTHKAAQKAQMKLVMTGPEPQTNKEKVKQVWRYYIPPVLSCGATVAFIIASNSVHNKRQAALITAVSLGETAFQEYREQITETLGKGKEQKARDELVQKNVKKAEDEGKFDHLVLKPDTQDQYVWDVYSSRALVSSVEKLNKAANDVARDCINHDYATLNQFYSAIGIEGIQPGDDVGWSNSTPLEIDLSNAVVRDGMGLIAINFVNPPMADFRDPWR